MKHEAARTRIPLIAALMWLSVPAVLAQSTAFTYQGRLQDGGTVANGSYDFQFTLWDAVNGGIQQPQPVPVTVTRTGVQVANGVFTTQLDFGATAFPGADRYLETSVRLAGSGGFTILSPRQQITSTPYAVRSLNASSVESVPVSAIPAGSGNYIQNTTSQQTIGNFNISGSGTAGGMLSANIVKATAGYNIGGYRVLSTPAGLNSIFAGVNAGAANTTGSSNAFFGDKAGNSNISGSWNAFIGYNAGGDNTTGNNNAFFGTAAGYANETGGNNAFYGSSAGLYSTTGSSNTFLGAGAGNPNTSTQVNFSTAIGRYANVSTDHTIVLGTSAETTRVPGIFSVGSDNAATRGQMNLLSPAGNATFYLQAAGATSGINFGVNSDAMLFIAQYDGTTYQDRFEITPAGTVAFNVLGGAGSTQLCRNALNEIATCSSSLRYKKDVARFSGGLDIINRLRPITFTWKQGGMPDLGLGAEEVAQVEPLLTFRNDKGEIEGVKYNQLSAVFINAFKEQQAQIQRQAVQIRQQQELIMQQQAQGQKQQEQIKQQQLQLNSLKILVCLDHPNADVCK